MHSVVLGKEPETPSSLFWRAVSTPLWLSYQYFSLSKGVQSFRPVRDGNSDLPAGQSIGLEKNKILLCVWGRIQSDCYLLFLFMGRIISWKTLKTWTLPPLLLRGVHQGTCFGSALDPLTRYLISVSGRLPPLLMLTKEYIGKEGRTTLW